MVVKKNKRIRSNNRTIKKWKQQEAQNLSKDQKKYQVVQQKHRELLDFLRKRQDYLEKKKPGILSNKSFLQFNENYSKMMENREERRAEIRLRASPIDWDSKD